MRSVLRHPLPGLGPALGLILVLALGLGPLHASLIRSLNIEEMTARADRIFSGRVVDVRVGRDPEIGREVTYTTFVVGRGVKGEVRGRVTIKTLGGRAVDERRPSAHEGVPRFRKGEEVILFLYGNSPLGLTSPVGFGQGKFAVVEDKEGRRLAVNGLGNRNLLRGLSRAAVARLGSSARVWKGRKAIPPDTLLEMIAELARPGEGPPAGRGASRSVAPTQGDGVSSRGGPSPGDRTSGRGGPER